VFKDRLPMKKKSEEEEYFGTNKQSFKSFFLD